MLINKKECKKVALAFVQEFRPGWGATRVSKKYLDSLNASVRNNIRRSVQSHCSVDKTIMDF